MLTYSANWWGEFEELDFWADLDYIGVSCYYPLEGSRREELAQSALRVRNRVGAVAKRYGKKVLLLEVGYPSRAGAALEPFKETDQGTPDAGHQADCCAALLAAFEPQPWFGGMLWWKWYNTLEALPPGDLSYMPHSKPTEEVLRGYFRRAALGR